MDRKLLLKLLCALNDVSAISMSSEKFGASGKVEAGEKAGEGET